MTTTLAASSLPLPLLRRGKVRDVYEVDDGRLLLVATDRVSAFDVVMREPVPHKGAVLTQLTAWWFARFEGRWRTTCSPPTPTRSSGRVPALAPASRAARGARDALPPHDAVPVECVVRGYIAGSAWKEYRQTGTLAGEPLPPGCVESDRLTRRSSARPPRRRPGTTRTSRSAASSATLGAELADRAPRHQPRASTSAGRDSPSRAGSSSPTPSSSSASTPTGTLVLIDEVLTPDSSRFWPADGYAPGRAQPSFDKQPLRDYLAGERDAGRWNGEAPPPALPADVVDATSARYLEAYRRITGTASSEIR